MVIVAMKTWKCLQRFGIFIFDSNKNSFIWYCTEPLAGKNEMVRLLVEISCGVFMKNTSDEMWWTLFTRISSYVIVTLFLKIGWIFFEIHASNTVFLWIYPLYKHSNIIWSIIWMYDCCQKQCFRSKSIRWRSELFIWILRTAFSCKIC